MDENRAGDGISLRYRFAYKFNYDYAQIAKYLDIFPCSILEMMVALAIIYDERFMYDPEYGPRIADWFWEMLFNMQLGEFTDENYNEKHVNYILSRFLNREYSENGDGGLFYVRNPKNDLRQTEIWYQMMWHINEVLEKSK